MSFRSEKRMSDTYIPCKYQIPMLIGFFLLNVIFLPVISATILFAFHVSVQFWIFPLSVVLSAILTCKLTGKNSEKADIVLFSGGICLLLVLLLCAHSYDFTWDGNTYHKSITGLLKDGWNPLYQTFYSYAEKFEFMSPAKAPWYDAYPKASELWAATVYAAFRNIEIGKAFNLLSMAALFCICWSFLSETKLLRGWQIALCSAMFSVNLIILSQCLSYYNDGFLWEMILLFLASLTYLTFYKDGIYKKICYYFIFLSVNMGFNIKFSAILFFGLTGFGFFGFWFVEQMCENNFIKSCKVIEERFFILAASVVSGFAVTGSTAYIINIIRHGNPLYVMIGSGSLDLITTQLPEVFKPLPNVVRFVCSLFSKTNNSRSMTNIEWKIPFTFFQTEIPQSQGYDTRIAGWGIFFSGVFLISVVYIAFYLFQNRKKEKRLMQVALILIGAVVIAAIFVPGLWWARYFVGMSYFPAVAFVLLCKEMNSDATGTGKYGLLLGALSAAMFFNMVPALTKNFEVIQNYKTISDELVILKDLTEVRDVKIWDGRSTGYHFQGRFFNLLDAGILQFEYGEVDSDNAVHIFPEYEITYSVLENCGI